MQKYFLYILYSDSLDKYYIGTSHDPLLRLHYHNVSNKGWTCRGRPWKLVFTKKFATKSDAQKWERNLKRFKKRSVIELIIADRFDWI